MIDILPSHVREWIVRLKAKGTGAPTIRRCEVILNAILMTALNDQIVFLHAGKGVNTPKVVKKPKLIVTAAHFDAIYNELNDGMYRLLVETDRVGPALGRTGRAPPWGPRPKDRRPHGFRGPWSS